MTALLPSVNPDDSRFDATDPKFSTQHDFFRNSPTAASDRSARAHVRNPLLCLRSVEGFRQLPDTQKRLLRRLLHELSQETRSRAKQCWTKRKAPMACYWYAVSVYARHLARVLVL